MKNLISVIVFFIFLFTSCEDCTDCPDNNENINHAPVIQHINVNPPSPVDTSIWVQINVIAIDEDDEELAYFWSATGGRIYENQINTNPTQWQSNQYGNFVITCTVSDGQETASGTTLITVSQ